MARAPSGTSSGETDRRKPLPAVDYLVIPDEGEPYLEGRRCQDCDAVFAGARATCSKCGARGRLEAFPLANRGHLYVYSIVHRSFPGIEVPYVSAVVDLEGGGTIKGNLIGIDPDPEKIELGMPVDVVYEDALGRVDREGNRYLSYFFQPRKA